IVYVPGNHDRLCNVYPSLRRRAREALGLAVHDGPFDHAYLDLDHAVYARHGQEWDSFNFEGSEALSYRTFETVPLEDYVQLPIGDLMASEVASRLPGTVRENLHENHPDRDLLYRRFQDLFDVRPLVSILEWLSYQASRYDGTVQSAVNDGMRQVGERFHEIPFVRHWIDRHDQIRNPFDEGDQLQLLLFMLETIKFTRFDRSLRRIERAEVAQEERYGVKAFEDFRRLDTDPELRDGVLFVLYGHTHKADQKAVGVAGEGSRERVRMYLNTGTWRPVHRQAVSGLGFTSWASLTYTIVYAAGEQAWGKGIAHHPTFETWTGAFRTPR